MYLDMHYALMRIEEARFCAKHYDSTNYWKHRKMDRDFLRTYDMGGEL
jgi:hypothetical protein